MKKGALSIAMATLTLAQTPGPEKTTEFEVASIKPTATKDGSFTFDFPPGGRFTGRNLTIQNLLRIAYELQDYQIREGPAGSPRPASIFRHELRERRRAASRTGA